MKRHANAATTRVLLVGTMVLAIAVALATTVALATPGQAAQKPLPHSLTVFGVVDETTNVDLGASGASDGDESFRHGSVHRTLTGPAIGEYFTWITTVRTDLPDGLLWTAVRKEYVLPGGMLLTEGVARRDLAQLASVGDVTHYVVVGGTGIYRGARGENIQTHLYGATYKNEFLFVR